MNKNSKYYSIAISKKFILILISIFILALIYFMIWGKNDQKIISVYKNTATQKFTNAEKALAGTIIHSFGKFVQIKKNAITKNYYLFLYSSSGCGNCIKKGFSYVKMIDSLYKENRVYVICESDGDASSDKLFFDYPGFIYTDQKAIIRRELKYVYTPVFFILDNNLKIINTHFFTMYDNIDSLIELKEDVEKIINQEYVK